MEPKEDLKELILNYINDKGNKKITLELLNNYYEQLDDTIMIVMQNIDYLGNQAPNTTIEVIKDLLKKE